MKTIWKIENKIISSISNTEYQLELILTCDIRIDSSHSCKTCIFKLIVPSDVEINNLTDENILTLCEQAGFDKYSIEQEIANNIGN